MAIRIANCLAELEFSFLSELRTGPIRLDTSIPKCAENRPFVAAQSIRMDLEELSDEIRLDGQQIRAGRAPYLKKRNEISIGISPDLLNRNRAGLNLNTAGVAFREPPRAKPEIYLALRRGMLCWRL